MSARIAGGWLIAALALLPRPAISFDGNYEGSPAHEQDCRAFTTQAIQDAVKAMQFGCTYPGDTTFQLNASAIYQACMGYGPSVRSQIAQDRKVTLDQCAGAPTDSAAEPEQPPAPAPEFDVVSQYGAWRRGDSGRGDIVAVFDVWKDGTGNYIGGYYLKQAACVPPDEFCSLSEQTGEFERVDVVGSNVRAYFRPTPDPAETHFIVFDAAKSRHNGQYGSGSRAFQSFWLHVEKVDRVPAEASLTQPASDPEPAHDDLPAHLSLMGDHQCTHNGSLMSLRIDEDVWEIAYLEPRTSLKKLGIRGASGNHAGSTLVHGSVSNGVFIGVSHLFSASCGAISYDVSGEAVSDGRMILQGPPPIRNDACEITGYNPDSSNARLVFDCAAK